MVRPGRTGRRERCTPSLVTYFGSASWLLAMAIVWFSAGLFLWWNTERTEQQVRATARAVAETVAATTNEAWLGQSAATLAPTLHEAASLPNIAFVRARLPNGGVLASAGNPGVATESVWIEQVPVTYFNQDLGSVEVAILRASGESLIRPWVWIAIATSVLGTVISAVVAFAVAFATTRPMRALQTTASHWEESEAANPVWQGGPREVQELGRAVLEMRDRALARTADLEEQVSHRTDQLRRAYTALEESFHGTAAALAQALDARDHMTARHAGRTAQLVDRIAERMGLGTEERRTLVLAATLHDIGKIGIPEHILTKPGTLTPAERAVMQSHPVIAATILEQVSGMAEVARLVRHHHERWDGKGYPDGLAGEQIPLGSRIIAMADTVEAMTARRHYRGPLTPEFTLAEVRRCSGTQFDPAVVDAGWEEVLKAVRFWTQEDLQEESAPPLRDITAVSGVSSGRT